MPVLLEVLAALRRRPVDSAHRLAEPASRCTKEPERFIELLTQCDFKQDRNIMAVVTARLGSLARPRKTRTRVGRAIYCILIARPDADQDVAERFAWSCWPNGSRPGSWREDRLARLRDDFGTGVATVATGDATVPLHAEAVVFGGVLGRRGIDGYLPHEHLASADQPSPDRIRALQVLAAQNRRRQSCPTVQEILSDPGPSQAAVSRCDHRHTGADARPRGRGCDSGRLSGVGTGI